MTYLLIGSIIGMVMGLTGSGGALVAIPLFMFFVGASVKSASILSLVAVILASLINFWSQRRAVRYQTAGWMVLSSAIGSYVFIPVKAMLPEWGVAMLLTTVSLYSLVSVWRKKPSAAVNAQEQNPKMLSLLSGFVLGGLTTLTGLGGGVMLMPLFVGLFRMAMPTAVATSLFTIALSSLISLMLQARSGFALPASIDLFWLTAGIFVSSEILKVITKKLSQTQLDLIRKLIFTGVVFLAIGKVFQ